MGVKIKRDQGKFPRSEVAKRVIAFRETSPFNLIQLSVFLIAAKFHRGKIPVLD